MRAVADEAGLTKSTVRYYLRDSYELIELAVLGTDLTDHAHHSTSPRPRRSGLFRQPSHRHCLPALETPGDRVTGPAYRRDEPKETDMTSPSLIEAFNAAQQRHSAAVAKLVPLLIEVALATVTDVLPGATVLGTEGEMNEDRLFTLRVQRVLDADSGVLYDISVGLDDPEVENRIDEVGFEYLELLLDITGDAYLGR